MNTEQELRLDPAALDAARRATGTIPGAAYWDDCARIITAYLAALPPAVAAGGVTATWHPLDAEGYAELRVNGARITTFASYPAAEEAADRINKALAVGDEGMREGWQPIETARKVVDETVLLRIEHVNFAAASADDKHRWEEIVTAYWTDFNRGGWVWHGLAGSPTDWRPLPTPPSRGEGV